MAIGASGVGNGPKDILGNIAKTELVNKYDTDGERVPPVLNDLP